MSKASEHWQEIRLAAYNRSGGKCEGCGVPLVRGSWHCHHLTYDRKGAELLEDVQALCLRCHNIRHPHHEFLSTAQQKIRRRQNGKRRRRRLKQLREREAQMMSPENVARVAARLAQEHAARKIANVRTTIIRKPKKRPLPPHTIYT